MVKALSPRSFGIVMVSLFIILMSISLFMWWRQTRDWQDQVIDEHMRTLQKIFLEIDADCRIIGFEHQNNYIDFLNVASFSGSEVGAMNLAYPEKWKGPYLKDNPTIQEKQYQIVRTHKGHYIVPGDGVVLSNGKIIGKDILFSEDADIAAMRDDPKLLNYTKYLLVAPLPLQSHKIEAELTVREKEIIQENSII